MFHRRHSDRVYPMSDYVLTASDYTYMDRAEFTYSTVKALIAETLNTYSRYTDKHDKSRPGIPGTIGELNERLATLIELRQFGTAARLIEKKVRRAYKIGPEQP